MDDALESNGDAKNLHELEDEMDIDALAAQTAQPPQRRSDGTCNASSLLVCYSSWLCNHRCACSTQAPCVYLQEAGEAEESPGTHDRTCERS